MKVLISLFLSIFLISCLNNSPQISIKNKEKIDNISSVAILPMFVSFSNDYKQMFNNKRNAQDWSEQERIAGVDLQQDFFSTFSKRSQKKNWKVIPQNFTVTNNFLSKNKIRYWDIINTDKASIGKMAGVDAVIYGTSIMDYTINGFRRGFNSTLILVDSQSGEILWQNDNYRELQSSMDSPQNVAQKSMDDLIRTLPFSTEKQ